MKEGRNDKDGMKEHYEMNDEMNERMNKCRWAILVEPTSRWAILVEPTLQVDSSLFHGSAV